MNKFLETLTQELGEVCVTDYSEKIRDYTTYEGENIISEQSIMTGSIFPYGSYEKYFTDNVLDSDSVAFDKLTNKYTSS